MFRWEHQVWHWGGSLPSLTAFCSMNGSAILLTTCTHSSKSSRTRSVAELIPDQAGATYWMRETTITRNMSCSDVVDVPWKHSSCIAYSKLLHDNSSIIMWSAAVSHLQWCLGLAGWSHAQCPDSVAVAPPPDAMRKQSPSCCGSCENCGSTQYTTKWIEKISSICDAAVWFIINRGGYCGFLWPCAYG